MDKYNLLIPFSIDLQTLTAVIIAEALAEGIPFVRVDLYDVNSNILFGEMTFIPDAGYTKYQPPEWDYILGTYLNLPVN